MLPFLINCFFLLQGLSCFVPSFFQLSSSIYWLADFWYFMHLVFPFALGLSLGLPLICLLLLTFLNDASDYIPCICPNPIATFVVLKLSPQILFFVVFLFLLFDNVFFFHYVPNFVVHWSSAFPFFGFFGSRILLNM